ncbi:hypothetical protein BHJ80_14595 [Escherichia coli]|nr:hypothetical protein BHJ80_14595 [Escherichia coli]
MTALGVWVSGRPRTSKRKSARLRKRAQTENFTPGRGNIITFGEPEPILTTGTEYINVWYNGSYNYWTLN